MSPCRGGSPARPCRGRSGPPGSGPRRHRRRGSTSLPSVGRTPCNGGSIRPGPPGRRCAPGPRAEDPRARAAVAEPSALGLNGPAFAPLLSRGEIAVRTESHVEVEVTVARSQRKHKTLRLYRLNRTDCVLDAPTGPLSRDRVARPGDEGALP